MLNFKCDRLKTDSGCIRFLSLVSYNRKGADSVDIDPKNADMSRKSADIAPENNRIILDLCKV